MIRLMPAGRATLLTRSIANATSAKKSLSANSDKIEKILIFCKLMTKNICIAILGLILLKNPAKIISAENFVPPRKPALHICFAINKYFSKIL